jgi:hypothetical protein
MDQSLTYVHLEVNEQSIRTISLHERSRTPLKIDRPNHDDYNAHFHFDVVESLKAIAPDRGSQAMRRS